MGLSVPLRDFGTGRLILLLLNSRGSHRADAGKSTRGQHQVTGTDRGSESFKKLISTRRTTTYQTEFIDTRVLAHVAGQVPVWHPIVRKGDRRVGVEPDETNYIWML